MSINHKANMEALAQEVVDLKVTKKQRQNIAALIASAFSNGFAAGQENDTEAKDHTIWLMFEVGKPYNKKELTQTALKPRAVFDFKRRNSWVYLNETTAAAATRPVRVKQGMCRKS